MAFPVYDYHAALREKEPSICIVLNSSRDIKKKKSDTVTLHHDGDFLCL